MHTHAAGEHILVASLSPAPTFDSWGFDLCCSKSTVDIDWDNIGFGIRDTDYMYVATCQLGTDEWRGSLRPFGNMTMSPSAAVLNYGQVSARAESEKRNWHVIRALQRGQKEQMQTQLCYMS